MVRVLHSCHCRVGAERLFLLDALLDVQSLEWPAPRRWKFGGACNRATSLSLFASMRCDVSHMCITATGTRRGSVQAWKAGPATDAGDGAAIGLRAAPERAGQQGDVLNYQVISNMPGLSTSVPVVYVPAISMALGEPWRIAGNRRSSLLDRRWRV